MSAYQDFTKLYTFAVYGETIKAVFLPYEWKPVLLERVAGTDSYTILNYAPPTNYLWLEKKIEEISDLQDRRNIYLALKDAYDAFYAQEEEDYKQFLLENPEGEVESSPSEKKEEEEGSYDETLPSLEEECEAVILPRTKKTAWQETM